MEITDHNENSMPNDVNSLGLQKDIYTATNENTTGSTLDIEEQENKKEQLLSKIKKAGRDFLTVTTLGSILLTAYGCSPKEINSVTDIEDKPTATLKSNLPVEENRPTPTHTLEPTITNTPTITPEPTPTEEPTPTPQPEIDPKEFDYSMLDLMQWEGELGVSDIEKLDPGHIVEVREGYKTVLYELPIFPLEKEEMSTYWSLIKILEIPQGTKFELLEKRKVTGEDGSKITFATLRNNSGLNTLEAVGVIALSAETEDGKTINFTEKLDEEISVASVFAEIGIPEQLPMSLFLRNLLEYQKENGPFKAGEQYSMVDIARIVKDDEFKRLLNWPEGNNGTLDKVVAALSNLLINEEQVATRSPSILSKNIETNTRRLGFPIGLNSVFPNKYSIGVLIDGGSSPENDVVLTFNEGKNGETEYYITGDMTGIKEGYIMPVGYMSFYLSSKLGHKELEASLERMEEVYQKHLNWKDGGDEPLTEDATFYAAYSPHSKEGLEKLKQVLDVIYTPMKKSDFFK